MPADSSGTTTMEGVLEAPPGPALGIGPGEELPLGTVVRLWSDSGALAGGCAVTVADTGVTSFGVIDDEEDASLARVSLGEVLYVGFPSPRGWGEFTSRVIGSCAYGLLTALTLARPERVVYRQRRRSTRVEARLPIHVWPTGHPDRAGVMVVGRTEDVGPTGVRAEFHSRLPKAERFTLSLHLDDGAELRVEARPVWHRAAGELDPPDVHRYGFHFTDLSQEARARLRDSLDRVRAMLAGESTARG